MIKVSFSKDYESGSVTMRVSGHAGQDTEGHDIVCSAASILAYTAAQTLKYIHLQGGLKREPLYRLASGDAFVTAQPKSDYAGMVLHTFFVAEVGYSLLAQNYPQYVELTPFNSTEKSC